MVPSNWENHGKSMKNDIKCLMKNCIQWPTGTDSLEVPIPYICGLFVKPM